MYKHILIATDGSELATKGLDHGLQLAKSIGAAVTIITVTENWSAFEMASDAAYSRGNPIENYEEMAARTAQKILDAAKIAIQNHGVEAETIHIADRHPAEGIIEAAKDKGCDLIVMASHGRRGFGRLLLGSQALEVLTHCTIPALIVR